MSETQREAAAIEWAGWDARSAALPSEVELIFAIQSGWVGHGAFDPEVAAAAVLSLLSGGSGE